MLILRLRSSVSLNMLLTISLESNKSLAASTDYQDSNLGPSPAVFSVGRCIDSLNVRRSLPLLDIFDSEIWIGSFGLPVTIDSYQSWSSSDSVWFPVT